MSNAFSRILPRSPRWDLPWGLLAALFALPAFVILEFTAGITIGLVAVLIGLSDTILDSTAATAVIYAAASAAAALPLLYVVRRWGANKLGFRPVDARKLALALPLFGLYFLGSVLVYSLVANLLPNINLEEAQELGFALTRAPVELTLIFISLVVIPPIVEEAYFRGFVYGGLRTLLGFWPAALISSIGFGLVHFQLNVALDTAVLGIASCWLYERTRSLWPPILLHAIKNLFAFVLVFILQAA